MLRFPVELGSKKNAGNCNDGWALAANSCSGFKTKQGSHSLPPTLSIPSTHIPACCLVKVKTIHAHVGEPSLRNYSKAMVMLH